MNISTDIRAQRQNIEMMKSIYIAWFRRFDSNEESIFRSVSYSIDSEKSRDENKIRIMLVHLNMVWPPCTKRSDLKRVRPKHIFVFCWFRNYSCFVIFRERNHVLDTWLIWFWNMMIGLHNSIHTLIRFSWYTQIKMNFWFRCALFAFISFEIWSNGKVLWAVSCECSRAFVCVCVCVCMLCMINGSLSLTRKMCIDDFLRRRHFE